MPQPTTTLKQTLIVLWKMLVSYPVWDVSYDVAVIFTLRESIGHDERPPMPS